MPQLCVTEQKHPSRLSSHKFMKLLVNFLLRFRAVFEWQKGRREEYLSGVLKRTRPSLLLGKT
jgi:hypothetical protein